jgi:hypothetical protein
LRRSRNPSRMFFGAGGNRCRSLWRQFYYGNCLFQLWSPFYWLQRLAKTNSSPTCQLAISCLKTFHVFLSISLPSGILLVPNLRVQGHSTVVSYQNQVGLVEECDQCEPNCAMPTEEFAEILPLPVYPAANTRRFRDRSAMV